MTRSEAITELYALFDAPHNADINLTRLNRLLDELTEFPPAQQEPVAWPAGLIERIKSAEQRIQDGHAPRRIPADPTDVDLVLAEVRYLLEGKQPPFWVNTTPQPAQRTWVGLTDEEAESVIDEIPGFAFGLDDGNLANGCVVLYANAIEAKLKEKNNGQH